MSTPAPLPAPPETKTVNQTAVTAVVGVITWILTTYIPVLHSGLPPALGAFLPWLAGAVLGALAGYFSRHTPRPDELVTQAAAIAGKIISDMENENRAIVPPPPVTAETATATALKDPRPAAENPAPPLARKPAPQDGHDAAAAVAPSAG
jgi:hypothetical protein